MNETRCVQRTNECEQPKEGCISARQFFVIKAVQEILLVYLMRFIYAQPHLQKKNQRCVYARILLVE